MNSSDIIDRAAREGKINEIDECGDTLLKSACRRGETALVQSLIALGADPNLPTDRGTPLHVAALQGHVEIVQGLLNAGANPNQVDLDGETPIMACHSLAAVELLLKHGATVASPTEPSPSGYGLDSVWQRHQDPEILDRLLQERDLSASERSLLLCHAVEHDDLDLASYWLARGADVDHFDQSGVTPLMLAAERGNDAAITLLLTRGADVSLVDEFKRTALFYAAIPEVGTGHYEVIQETAKEPFWSSAIEESSIRSLVSEPEMVESILNSLTSPSAKEIEKADYSATMRALVKGGANIESQDEDQWTPLLVACYCGSASRVKTLLELGADTAAQTPEGWKANQLAQSNEDAEQKAAILALLAGASIASPGTD